ncbi:MAG: hypothetical protein ACSLE2_13905 [Lysobacterales bacterium]
MPSGPATVPAGMTYEQNCGLTVDATNVPAYVTTNTPVNESQVRVRFYFLADLLEITSGEVVLLRARDGGTTQFEVLLNVSGSVKRLLTRYSDGEGGFTQSAAIPLQDVWIAVETAWTTGAGNGSFSLKLDDVLQFEDTTLNNDGDVVNEVDLGVVNSANTLGEIAFDAFMLRRAGAPGLLTVNELWNISTRANVQTVNEITIGGFVISGDTQKCVVIRGRGPSIGGGIAAEDKLSDPRIELKIGSTTIETNDNWGDSPEAALMTSLGLAPPNALEAAIYACLDEGPYTALLRGTGGLTGIGIVEVFDADVGTPYLYNISTRARVDVGDLVAIGGFIIEGDQSKQVLIRGRGPSIGDPNITNKLANPRVRLVGTGVDITNDNWQDTQGAAISATGLAPPNAAESAILITLPPGNYTTILSGVGIHPNNTGVGIVEVYDLSGSSVGAQ